tara:strand:- start:169162 stop:169758 length:597 start_codon:yes stop_codon:yes gene_type:complete
MLGMSRLTAHFKRNQANKADFNKLKLYLADLPAAVSAVFEADIVDAAARLDADYGAESAKQKLRKAFSTVTNNLNVFIVLDHQEQRAFPVLDKHTLSVNPEVLNKKNIAALQGAFDALHDVALKYGCAFSPSNPQELLEQAAANEDKEQGLSIAFNRYAPYRIFNHPRYDRFDNDVQHDLRVDLHSRIKQEISSTPRW